MTPEQTQTRARAIALLQADPVMAPPSADDYGLLPFLRVPLQLVDEMNGRVWGVFSGGTCSLLGTLNAQGGWHTTAATII